MVVQQALADRHIPFLCTMVLLVTLNPLGIHNKCRVLDPKLEVPHTGGMIISDVLPDNGQLEPYSNDLPDNGFLHSETDPDTTSLPLGLKETYHKYFSHVDFFKDASMPLIDELDTSGLRRSACLDGKPPKNSPFLS